MELLSPAGNYEAFLAAINNGADAVYMGGKLFNARQSAANFNDEELKKALDYAHAKGRKIYVTVNTLLDSEEFNDALEYIFKLQTLGADAIIVQDIGLLQAVKNTLPNMRIHSSTQMTIHNIDGLNLMASLGIERVVLAREMSLKDLQLINAAKRNIEIEVFVHGAICYSFSGQCLFSSMIGNRSGNRGRCAQPCRLPYRLFDLKTEQIINLKNRGKYLMSPADLCLIDDLTDLIKAGVDSIKIEGRMKRAEYVAVVTRNYRRALDVINEALSYKSTEEVKKELLKIFNRNFSSGYLIPPYRNFLSTQTPKNRGIYAGKVVGIKNNNIAIQLVEPVIKGDGIVIWVKQGSNPALFLNKFVVNDKLSETAQTGDTITVNVKGNIAINDPVFKTHDEKLLIEARQSITPEKGKIPVKAIINMEIGQPAELIFEDNQGNKGKSQSRSQAVEAIKEPLNEKNLKEKLGRLGNTNFELNYLMINGNQNVIIPYSELNEMRRIAIEDLINQSTKLIEIIDCETFYKNKIKYLSNKSPGKKANIKTKLSIMVNTVEQARAAVESEVKQIYLSLEGLGQNKKISRKDFSLLADWAQKNQANIIPALPTICKPLDRSLRQAIMDWGCDHLMVSNWGDLKWAVDNDYVFSCNYNFNIFNQWAMDWLISQGAASLCLSPELNIQQLQKFSSLEKAEFLVHGELIIMQSQFCLLKGLLEKEGGQNCSAFCKSGSFAIIDEKGYRFPLENDRFCRQYIFNSRTLCMIDKIDNILKLNPAYCRIEARRLSPEQIKNTVELYTLVMDNYYSPKKKNIQIDILKEELLKYSNSQFTKCHYYRGVL